MGYIVYCCIVDQVVKLSVGILQRTCTRRREISFYCKEVKKKIKGVFTSSSRLVTLY